MRLLHIANTNFEWELIQKKPLPIHELLQKHPVFLQLQFLPFLYASQEDGVAVTQEPPAQFWKQLKTVGIIPARLHLLSSCDPLPYDKVESWGASQAIANWAHKHQLPYKTPDFKVVKEVNSKLFSFTRSPKLPRAKLLYEENEAKKWLAEQKIPSVLKTCFGVSGRGHLIIDSLSVKNLQKIELFLKREWEEGLPVIAEPWVKRVLDFSTQWEILENKEIQYIGATICENDPRGGYRQNQVGPKEKLFGRHSAHIENHCAISLPILKEMASLGYFGNVGIDSMVYQMPGNPDKELLHPIVEINARKTMGWVALILQKRFALERILSLKFIPFSDNSFNLLPSSLPLPNGSDLNFSRSLSIDFLS